MPAATNARNCIRCQSPLPDGSAYCVSCGCNNEGLLDDKLVKVNNQLESRRNWENWCKVFPFLRWFEK
jgi:hypothetical protein